MFTAGQELNMFTFFKKLRKKPAPAEVSGTPEPVFTFSGWVVSDLGRVRENNEDNFLLGDRSC